MLKRKLGDSGSRRVAEARERFGGLLGAWDRTDDTRNVACGAELLRLNGTENTPDGTEKTTWE